MEVIADAAGTFSALFRAGEGGSSVGDVTVRNAYTIYSHAETGAAGGLSGSIVEGAGNTAKATTSVSGSAGFGSDGTLRVQGDVLAEVQAIGDAIATVSSHRLTLSGVRVAVNEVRADFNARQSASVVGAGTADVSGSVTIRSLLNEPESGSEPTHGAQATVRGPAGSLNLLKGDTNNAYANATSQNDALIESLTLTAQAVTLLAKTHNFANAQAINGSSISLTTFGNLYAESHALDSANATISGATITTTAGDVDVDSRIVSTSTSTAHAAGSASGISVTNSNAKAYVGSADAEQSSRVSIEDGSVIVAAGNVELYAYNTGYAESIITKGGSFSIGRINASTLPTESYYDTYAGITDESDVTAANISVKAEDYTRAKSDAWDQSIAVTVSVATTHGENTIHSDTNATINARLFATDDVSILADSNAWMYARTYSSQRGGFVADGDMHAYNTLKRNVAVDILSGADIEADFGEVLIRADAGSRDTIYTEARVDNTSFVAIGKADAHTDVSTSTTVKVERGANLENRFGYIRIYTNASVKDVHAYSHVYNAGLGNEPDAKSLGDLKLTSQIDIGQAGAGTANLLAKFIDIRSYFGDISFHMESYARGRGLGVNVDTTSQTDAKFANAVNVANATLRAYDDVIILADGRPNYSAENIFNDSYSFAQGIGEATAWIRGTVSSASNVNIGDGTDIYGAYVNIDAEAFSGGVRNYPHTKITGIAGGYRRDYGAIQNSRSMTVSSGVRFHIGDAAAGIAIDISERGVRHAGLPEEDGRLIRAVNGEYIIAAIANAIPGTLDLGEHTIGGYTVFNQRFIPEVRITNRTDARVTLEGIAVENTNFVQPSVRGGVNYTVRDSLDQTPEVLVETGGTGDVHVSGIISNRRGLVRFAWTGEEGGKLTSLDDLTLVSAAGALIAPVWAHELEIINASGIGEGADDRFSAFLFVHDGEEGTVNAQTTGASYMRITPVLFEEVQTLPDPGDTSAFTPNARVETVLAEGDNDLELSPGIRLYQLSGSQTVAIPLPGTLQYVSGVLKGLTGNAVIDAEALERYQDGYVIAEDAYVYRLPNGTTLYVDAQTGEILRLIETVNGSEVITDLGDYEFIADANGKITSVVLGEGVTLDLTTGKMKLEEGVSYETLLSVIDSRWIMDNIGKDDGQFMFVYEVPTGNFVEVVKDDGTIEMAAEYKTIESTLTKWRSEGTVTYYFLKNGSPNAEDFMDGVVTYLVANDTSTNTMSVYVIGGDDYLEEQAGHNEDSYNYYTDGDGNTVTVDEDMADNWEKEDYILENLLGSLVLHDDPKVLDITYVSVENFLGIQGFTGYYNVTDQSWYYASESALTLPWHYEKIPFVQLGNGVYYLEEGTTFTREDMLSPALGGTYTLGESVFMAWDVEHTTKYDDNDYYSKGAITVDSDGQRWLYYFQTNELLLDVYDVNVYYTTLRDGSVSIAPAMADEGDEKLGYYEVNLYETASEDDSEPSGHYADIYGAIENVPIKLQQMPANDYDYVSGNGYRINDYLYIHKDTGNVLMLVPDEKDNIIFSAVFDGSTYESNYMILEHADALLSAFTQTPSAEQPVITLKSGVQVQLERLTDDIATDAQGRFWYLNGADWVEATVATADGVTSVSYGGTTYLTIETANDVLYYTLVLDGLRVGSDGSVEVVGASNQTQKIVETKGTQYPLGVITGENVTITMTDGEGSLLDGREPGETRPNIEADGNVTFVSSSSGSIGTEEDPLDIVAGGEVIFENLVGGGQLETDTFIHAEEGDIVIQPGTVVVDVLLEVTAEAGSIALTDVTVISEDDGDQNDGVLRLDAAKDIIQLDPVGGEGALSGIKLVGDAISKAYTDIDAGGSITLDQILSENGEADIDAAGTIDIPLVDTERDSLTDLDSSEGDIHTNAIEADGSEVIYNAAGSITATDVTAENGADISLTAGTDIETETILADASGVTYDAGGSITATDVTAENGADITLTAGADIGTETILADASDVTYDADGGITTDRIDADNGSAIDFDAGAAITVPELDLNDSTLDFLAGEDVTIDILEGANAETILRSENGNIFGEDAQSYIRLTGDSALTLSAGADIGKEDSRLIVDVPETLTVRIEQADNIHLDGVLLEGGAFEGERPIPDIRDGRGESGETLSGDFLADGGSETFHLLINTQGAEALTAWITGGMAREQWQTLISAAALSGQIAQGGIAPATLEALLADGETLTVEDIRQMLLDEEHEALGQLLAQVLPATQVDPDTQIETPVVSDELAAAWLESAIAAGQVEGLADALSSLMTQEEILAILEQAWEQAGYEDVSTPEPEDPDARALNISIGASHGETHMWNEGDINITQDEGDFTAADVHSERGDISIRTENGDILGAQSDTPNLYGENIELSASGSIGSDERALTIEQQADRPALVGNIASPAQDADGNYDITLVERPVTETVLEPVLDDNGQPVLDADGQPMMAEVVKPVLDENGNPVTEWVAEVEIVYDWLRVDYPGEATRLDASAGEDISIRETTGDLGVGNVSAGGDVSLSAPGSILDTREDGETQGNLASGGDAMLTSDEGTIGTSEEYLDIDVDGTTTARAEGDINIADRADLDLVADTAEGQVNADAAGDLDLRNSDPETDLIIGPITAGGDAQITATGSLVAGDPLGHEAQVSAGSIGLTAQGGDVGTAETPILVDTDAENGGTLSVEASGDGYVAELTGDVILDTVTTGGDMTLTVPGDVTDVDDAQKVVEAVEAAKDAEEARAEADSMQAQADILDHYASDEGRLQLDLNKQAAEEALEAAQEELARAEEALEDLQDQLEQLENDPEATQEQLDALAGQIEGQQEKVDDLTKTVAERQEALDEINDLIDIAKGNADEAQKEADRLAALADALEKVAQDALEAAQGGDTITTGGDLTIDAGGAIGAEDNALGMDVTGSVDLTVGDPATDGVDIESTGDVNLGPIEGEHVSIDALGDIQAAGDEDGRDIVTGELNISTTGGDVGSEDRPIRVSVDELTAMGEEVYIENDKDLTIDSVIGDKVDLEVGGDVLPGDNDEKPNIVADDLTIDADGDIGSKDDPLHTDVDHIDAEGEDIYLDNDSGELDIGHIKGDHVEIETDGSVTGGPVEADDLVINAGGDVGAADDPLDIIVPGDVDINSQYGWTYWQNGYRAPRGEGDSPYIERTLTDRITQVSLHGLRIHRDAWLVVTDLTELLEASRAEALAALDEQLRAALESEAMVAAWRVELRVDASMPAWLGSVDVRLPVGDAWEGKPLLVLAFFTNGDMGLYGGIVEDGMLAFETERLGAFIVLDPALYEEVFALLHGTFNYALRERITVSDEALRILEAAYMAWREQLAEALRESGEENDLPEQIYLLGADFGIELTLPSTPEAEEALAHGLRLEAQRPQKAEQPVEQPADEDLLPWALPKRVELALTRTDIVEGVPVVTQVQLDGECELLLRLWQDPSAPDPDEESDYPYRYQSHPVTLKVTLANGDVQTLTLETDAEGVLRLSLHSVPVAMELVD